MSTWSDLIREAREDNEPRSWCGGCALWRLAFEGAEAPRPDGAVARDGGFGQVDAAPGEMSADGPAVRDAHRLQRDASSAARDVRNTDVPAPLRAGASNPDSTDLGSTR
jgi:hypothetical protein